MLAYWPADRSFPVLDITVGDMLREAAAAAPGATALVAGNPGPSDRGRWTYTELLEQSEQAARALLGRFEPGERDLPDPRVPWRAFNPGLMLELIESERVECVIAVPTMHIGVLGHPGLAATDVSSVRLLFTGGAVVPPALVKRVEAAFGAPMCIVFAQTEASPVITETAPGDATGDREETLGRPLPDTEVKIIDAATGDTVAPGVIGELCTRGYHMMTGYLNDPEATAAAIDAEGWLHTGDLGSMDDRGYCLIGGGSRT